MIPYFDLKQQTITLKKEIIDNMEQVIHECAFSGGKYVERFEKNFASFCETDYAVGVNSGTSALHLSLQTLDIGQGDEVILPANSFIATAWAVSYVGAQPVFVDCDPRTWNITIQNIKNKITSQTKALICVHLYGSPCDMEKLLEIKEKHQLYLIEDCAQSHGAEFKDKKTGTFGEAGAFSFYPGKNLGAFGEAGAVVTEDKQIAERVRRLRDHGSSRKYHHEEVGYNMRMDGIQAAVLDVKLKYLNQWNMKRQRIAGKYLEAFQDILPCQLVLENTKSVYHLFVVTVKNRDKFISYLDSCGITVGMHYPIPIHLQNAYKHLGHQTGNFPHSELLSESCVSLPMYPELSDSQVDQVIDSVCNYFKEDMK